MSDFKFIQSKKKKRRGKFCRSDEFDEQSDTYFERLKEKVLNAQGVVSASDVYCTIQQFIEECLSELKQPGLPEIVCYGLGNISEDQNVRYQFGLVLELKKHFQSTLFLYDPVFKKVEKEVMVDLNCSLIDCNEMGNRKISGTTLFFLPHCPHELMNNVIAANWSEKLCDCIILSNSVNSVCSLMPETKLNNDLPYFKKILPFVSEMEVHNTFKPVGAFNDLSLHLFVKEKYKDEVFNNTNGDLAKLVNSIEQINLGNNSELIRS